MIFDSAYLVHFWIGWIPSRITFSLGRVLFDCLLSGLFLDEVVASCIGYLFDFPQWVCDLDSWCIYFAHLTIWSPREGLIQGSLWWGFYSLPISSQFPFELFFGKRQAAALHEQLVRYRHRWKTTSVSSSWATCMLLLESAEQQLFTSY